jgi:hypothetical protein
MSFESGSENPSEPQSTEKRAMPQPTYAPFMLAVGVTMMFWGLATSPIMSASGFIVLAWGLWTWISEIAGDWSR